MITDVVVAALDRETLADVLPVVHTHGLGHVARVLTVDRGELRGQLKRMGIPAEQAPESLADSGILLVLSAAARSPMAAGLVLRSGASTAWVVTRNGEWNAFDDAVMHMSPMTPAMPASPPQGVPSVPGLHDVPRVNPTIPDPAAP